MKESKWERCVRLLVIGIILYLAGWATHDAIVGDGVPFSPPIYDDYVVESTIRSL